MVRVPGRALSDAGGDPVLRQRHVDDARARRTRIGRSAGGQQERRAEGGQRGVRPPGGLWDARVTDRDPIMIWRPMNRRLRVLLLGLAAVLVAVLASACGTQNINVPNTAADAAVHHGAVLFNQRCSGCHSLNYAAANGSASNPRIAQANSGPNFNVRCERPDHPGALRDRERRFLRRDHAPEHRRRQRRDGRGQVRGHLRGPARAQADRRQALPVQRDRHAPGARARPRPRARPPQHDHRGLRPRAGHEAAKGKKKHARAYVVRSTTAPTR